MDVHVLKKLLLSFPDSDDVVSQPLDAWRNRNAKDLSGSKLLVILWISMNLNDFPAPISFQNFI